MPSIRDLPAIVGSPPPFDPASAPAGPHHLFLDWLDAAIDASIPEPHAATLSTVDAAGSPDARVLTLKDVTADGSFEIASGGESAKGAQLAANPACALSFYWTPLARAVRIRGVAMTASPEESAADFRARATDAKAIALLGRQGDVIRDDEDPAALIAASASRLEQDPATVSPEWTVWRIRPEWFEFWQGAPDRAHQRLRYRRDADAWIRECLWA